MRYLGGYFERKKDFLNRSQDKTNQAGKAIKTFLKSRFGDNLTGLSLNISYSSENGVLTISAGNKILANELSICLADISDALKKENIKVKQIIIH